MVTFSLLISGVTNKPEMAVKSNVPNSIKHNSIAKTNPISPTLFINIAFIAALFAFILVSQKLIKR
jgi:hypothetical protein